MPQHQRGSGATIDTATRIARRAIIPILPGVSGWTFRFETLFEILAMWDMAHNGPTFSRSQEASCPLAHCAPALLGPPRGGPVP